MSTISYPIDFPTVKDASRISITGRSVVAISESPFSLQQQVQNHQGQRWEVDITIPVAVRADAEEFNAFFLKLNGREGSFLFGDPSARTPRGAASSSPGSPQVKGSSQTGGVLIIDGAPANTTGWLLTGDYVQIDTSANARLHKVLFDADTSTTGEVTLRIWPNLRSSPADNTQVTVSSAKGRFRLNSNVMTWGARPGAGSALFQELTFTAIEVIDNV